MRESDSKLTSAQSVPPVSVFCRINEELRVNPLIVAPKKPGILGTLDRFELIDVLGEGGMGVVFLARDASASAPPVAIKILKAELAPDERAVEYFLKEARHMQRLSHPNILPVLEFSQKPNGAYFVMPHMERGSLDRWLQSGKPLDEALTRRIALELASALNCAHSRGIIHRDIKPRNILLDAQGRVCLTDFGLSRSLLNDSLTDVRRDTVEGTPHYLSPSAARGEHEDTRGDIYAFGAVLYEMLTGRPPYSGATREEILRKIQTAGPTPIRELNPAAPPSLVKVAERAMARSLADRYSHISYVVTELESADNAQCASNDSRRLWPAPSGRLRTLLVRPAARFVMGIALLAACALGIMQWMQRDVSPGSIKHSSPRLTLDRKITLPGIFHWGGLQDWNKDGVPEFIAPLQVDRKFLVVSARGQVLREWGLPDPTGENPVLFLGDKGAGQAEFLVSWRNGTNLTLTALNQQLHEMKRFSCLGSVVKSSVGMSADSGITDAQIVDLDHDGRFELLMIVGSGYARKPRELYCYDFGSGTLLWQHQTGPSLKSLVVADLDGDGVEEVVVGSDAVGNGNRASDETDDEHSYIFAFSSKGSLLWKPTMGALHTQAKPVLAASKNAGRKELVAWVTGTHEYFAKDPSYEEVGRIVRLSDKGDVMGEYNLRVRLMSCVSADLDQDGSEEILATDRFGSLHRLGHDLSPQSKVQAVPNKFGFVELTVAAVENVWGDARPEIILSSMEQEIVRGMNPGFSNGELNVRFRHDVAVVVLDTALNPIAKHTIAEKWDEDRGFTVRVARLGRDKEPELMILTDGVEIMRFE